MTRILVGTLLQLSVPHIGIGTPIAERPSQVRDRGQTLIMVRDRGQTLIIIIKGLGLALTFIIGNNGLTVKTCAVPSTRQIFKL